MRTHTHARANRKFTHEIDKGQHQAQDVLQQLSFPLGVVGAPNARDHGRQQRVTDLDESDSAKD